MSARPESREQPPAPLYKRLLWMAGIWVLSVLVLGMVATAIRWVIRP